MMKRFKFLGALFVWLITLVSFWYCWIVHNFIQSSSISSQWIKTLNNNDCFRFTDNFCARNYTVSDFNWNVVFTARNNYSQSELTCVNWSWYYYTNTYSSSCTIQIYSLWDWYCPSCDCPICEEQYTSEECQQEYSLMPISSCNSEYCWLNWLCPVYTGSTMSELYINWINHLGALIINISIPLEQAWDYEYTWDVMNINLSWENNVDYEYIDNIIKTQRSTPDDEDLNTIVSWLIPLFVPWLVLIVFIIFIFRFIKKIF